MYFSALADVYDAIRGLLFPARHEFGFTADMDNADFPPDVLGAFRKVFARDMTWWGPSAAQKRRFKTHEASKFADNLLAVSREGRQEYWVLDSDWAGFPDPAEFLFLGFARDKTVFAAGRFEDWPDNWQRV